MDEQINKLLKKYSLTDVVDIVHKLTNISKKIVYKKALEQKKMKKIFLLFLLSIFYIK